MIRQSPELNRNIRISYRTLTRWGIVAVVEMLRPYETLVKAVQVPHPSMTSEIGIWVPERRGEFRLPNGDRFHQIGWKGIITGGCNPTDRRHIQTNGIIAVVIPIRYDPDEYYRLLLGRGLLFR